MDEKSFPQGKTMHIHPLACGLGLAFLIETPQGLFLVDSGSPGQEEQVLAKMRQLGRSNLKLIWISHAHYDHYGSAAALRRLTGAPIGVHPADAAGQSPLGTPHRHGFFFFLAQPLLKRIWPLPATRPDFTLADGETLERYGLNARVLHTPGHTPGHTALLLEGGIAFAADLIARVPHPRLQDLLATDWGQLSASLAHLQAARPEWTYTGHTAQAISASALQGIRP